MLFQIFTGSVKFGMMDIDLEVLSERQDKRKHYKPHVHLTHLLFLLYCVGHPGVLSNISYRLAVIVSPFQQQGIHFKHVA